MPEWEERLGGPRVRDQTWHPPIGPADVRVRVGAHPLLSAPSPSALPGVVEVVDEVYCGLRVSGDVVVLAEAPHEGRTHPPVRVREDARGTRTAYDALGHDERSSDSAGHLALLGRLARRLLAPPVPRT